MKKVYKAPVLVVYGDVIELTQGLGFGAGKDTYSGTLTPVSQPGSGATGPVGPGGPGTLSAYLHGHG